MKKIILLGLFVIGFQIAVLAQPVISLKATPKVGDELQITTIEASTLSTGLTGDIVTWDFSDVVPLHSQTAKVVSASNTPHGASFPNADIAVAYSEGLKMGSTANVTYEFFSDNGNQFMLNGLTTDNLVVNYSNPQTLTFAELTYGDRYKDDFSGNFKVNKSAIEKTGKVKVNVDAYGTLILPYGTLEDVLRIKTVREYTDKLVGTEMTFDYLVETYAWYHPSFSYPLLVISNETVKDSPKPAVSTAFYAQIDRFNQLNVSFETPNTIRSDEDLLKLRDERK